MHRRTLRALACVITAAAALAAVPQALAARGAVAEQRLVEVDPPVLALVDLHAHVVAVVDHAAIGARVDPARIGVASDHRAAGGDVAPTIQLVHFRVEKPFNLAKGRKISLRMNIYNLTNTNAARTLTQQSGPSYQVPLDIMPPRIVEFGVNYTF